PAQSAFVIQMAEDYVTGEAPELDAARLGASLADLWRFAGRRDAEPAIRIVRLGPSDRLDIVQADQPFLVDSVMGEITERRIPIQAMFHAVVDVARDAKGDRTEVGEAARESMIQVFLDPLGDDQATALIAGLAGTLADVRLAVGDYGAMLAMTDRAIGELDARAGDLPAAQLREYQDFLSWMRDQHFIFLGARCGWRGRPRDGRRSARGRRGWRPDGPRPARAPRQRRSPRPSG
ncbi:MAG TPA: NAD-glutamate dehydrogenase, partial [Caulobacteraceae bacterium]|nr:NAD-glutamate dehydrogenase [Caulobacteraceae bacterium]